MPKKQSKFWNFTNPAGSESVDLLLYGPISDETWWGDEVTPQQFANDLAAQGGKDVCVRINSLGGDVFAAHSMLNQLRTYSGNVTVRIDGVAASAATIVMLAGKCTMPTNAAVMIHNPSVCLFGSYTADDMDSMSKELAVVKQTIMNAYKQKCGMSDEELSQIMDEEEWLTAEQMKAYGLIDEIDGETAVQASMQGEKVFVNGVGFDRLPPAARKILHVNGMVTAHTAVRKGKGEDMPINSMEELMKEKPELVKQVQDEAVASERSRMNALDALDDPANAAVHEIIADAKESGKTAADIQKVVDIVKKNTAVPQPEDKAGSLIADMLADNKASGVDGIQAGGKPGEKQEENQAISNMVKIINKKNGRTA